ncbi:inosose dehydratase [Microbacterium sp. W4I4]|uniref:sugar phosphate isomerase/epimerase family protein n=1 Tax=Microbacterium sp. W4I4 TaxID=3042295 RepID=UPI002780188F|nr:sugar phosphate isomerase/epimerase [Microbacterium sp. W4I4]MDQ0615359.1 inosose dehydratase [Microbacterium sp. W4I4]
MTMPNVRMGATLITFYNTAWWGLPKHMEYGDWVAEVQSKPKYYFDHMLDSVAAAGVEGVELAPIPGGWEGALQAYGHVAGVRAAFDVRGLTLGSSYADGGSLIGNALEDSAAEGAADDYIDRHARFVAEMGADIIVMGTVPRAQFSNGSFDSDVPREASEKVASQINRLGAVAGRHGVRIALHTDAYSVCSRNHDIDTMMSLTDPANVELCLDAGHTTLDGGDAVAVLDAHVGRVPVMHWKDCIAPLDGSTLSGPLMKRHETMLKYFRIFGDGIIDWKAWQRVLADNSWRGWAMAENDMAPDPIAEVRHAVEFFEKELAVIYK